MKLKSTCKEICKKFRVTKPVVGGRYEAGQARCQICDIWLDYRGGHLKNGSPLTSCGRAQAAGRTCGQAGTGFRDPVCSLRRRAARCRASLTLLQTSRGYGRTGRRQARSWQKSCPRLAVCRI